MIKSNLRTCTSKMVMSHRETALHRARFIQQHTKRLINVVTMVKSKLRTFMSKMTM
jgi:ribosomal protein S20